MKQVTQARRGGKVVVRDVPTPALRPGWILVANRFSLISAGTERSTVQSASRGIVGGASSDVIKKVAAHARANGVRSTASAVRARLDAERSDRLRPLGYSSSGVVMRVAPSVVGIAPGDHVACGGAGWASHAEIVAVPRNLVAKVPIHVPLDHAAFATLGSIALHAVRQAGVTVGERVGVVGLGLLGQLVIRILIAAGCDPIGVDLDPSAVELCRRTGCEAVTRGDSRLEGGVEGSLVDGGLDAVIVCAATASDDPLRLAAGVARDRGRLVVVGDVPVSIERALLYEKELELRIARSYGPGRYDRDYEEYGRDLPIGYVRWTEGRNLQAFVDFLARGKVEVASLTTHRFSVDSAPEAYALLTDRESDPRPFGILLEYPDAGRAAAETVALTPARAPRARRASQPPRVGVIGAGSFAQAVLLPALQAEGARLVAVATQTGLSAVDVAARFGFESALAPDQLIASEDIDAVVIATRHATHASLAVDALHAGKAVFVEKPLGLTGEELDIVEEALGDNILMVGFNRRYADLVERLRSELPSSGDAVLTVRVNAGPLPQSHWLHDPLDGGGRLVGEGCHFVDLLSHLARSPVARVHAFALSERDRSIQASDSVVASLQFENGSVGTFVYTGSGDPRLPKERVEAFAGGVALVLDDFTQLRIYRGRTPKRIKAAQDKGHRALVRHFLQSVAGSVEPPPVASYLNSSRATLALVESLRCGEVVGLR